MPLPPTIIPIKPRVGRQRREAQAGAPAVNASLLRVFETVNGGLLLMFDRIVTVDPDNPPTTWSVNGSTSIQPGRANTRRGVKRAC